MSQSDCQKSELSLITSAEVANDKSSYEGGRSSYEDGRSSYEGGRSSCGSGRPAGAERGLRGLRTVAVWGAGRRLEDIIYISGFAQIEFKVFAFLRVLSRLTEVVPPTFLKFFDFFWACRNNFLVSVLWVALTCSGLLMMSSVVKRLRLVSIVRSAASLSLNFFTLLLNGFLRNFGRWPSGSLMLRGLLKA